VKRESRRFNGWECQFKLRPHPRRSLHNYPTPLHVVLPSVPIEARSGPLPRSQRIKISEAASVFPRRLQHVEKVDARLICSPKSTFITPK